MELTGTTEPGARNVFMMVCPPGGEPNSTNGSTAHEHPADEGREEPAQKPRLKQAAAILLLSLAVCGVASAEQPSGPFTNQVHIAQPFGGPLSLADAINLAMRQSPAILRAQKDLEASKGIAIQTRAIALPTLGVGGSYARVQRTDVDVFEAPGFTFGTPQNWSTQVKLIQSLYQGGRMLSSFRAARLTRQQSVLSYQTAVADTVLAVQLSYYDVLLAAQQITVQEASVALL